jgi:hypothetical protein
LDGLKDLQAFTSPRGVSIRILAVSDAGFTVTRYGNRTTNARLPILLPAARAQGSRHHAAGTDPRTRRGAHYAPKRPATRNLHRRAGAPVGTGPRTAFAARPIGFSTSTARNRSAALGAAGSDGYAASTSRWLSAVKTATRWPWASPLRYQPGRLTTSLKVSFDVRTKPAQIAPHSHRNGTRAGKS